MLSDRRYPCFRNFHSAVSIDVIRMRSYFDSLFEKKKHLSSVVVSNGYPSSFIRKLTKTTRPTANNEPTQEFKSTAILPYIKGVS